MGNVRGPESIIQQELGLIEAANNLVAVHRKSRLQRVIEDVTMVVLADAVILDGYAAISNYAENPRAAVFYGLTTLGLACITALTLNQILEGRREQSEAYKIRDCITELLCSKQLFSEEKIIR